MNSTGAPPVDLSIVDEVIARRGTHSDRVIPMLQDLQAHYGYLPISALNYLAAKTDATPAQIYGVVTFYSQFRLKPVGRHMIRVCHGTACHVQGANPITQAVCDTLHIQEGETTEDGEYTLESVACLGCCSLAPVMMIDETVYGRLSRAEVQKIFKQRAKQEAKA